MSKVNPFSDWKVLVDNHEWTIYHKDDAVVVKGKCGCVGWLAKLGWDMLPKMDCTHHKPNKAITMALLLYTSKIVR